MILRQLAKLADVPVSALMTERFETRRRMCRSVASAQFETSASDDGLIRRVCGVRRDDERVLRENAELSPDDVDNVFANW